MCKEWLLNDTVPDKPMHRLVQAKRPIESRAILFTHTNIGCSSLHTRLWRMLSCSLCARFASVLANVASDTLRVSVSSSCTLGELVLLAAPPRRSRRSVDAFCCINSLSAAVRCSRSRISPPWQGHTRVRDTPPPQTTLPDTHSPYRGFVICTHWWHCRCTTE
jgi:hypothetical protein